MYFVMIPFSSEGGPQVTFIRGPVFLLGALIVNCRFVGLLGAMGI